MKVSYAVMAKYDDGSKGVVCECKTKDNALEFIIGMKSITEKDGTDATIECVDNTLIVTRSSLTVKYSPVEIKEI